jgi:hypothetical protein
MESFQTRAHSWPVDDAKSCITDRFPLGGDKGYDTEAFIKELRKLKVTPQVAQNNSNRKSAFDGRSSVAINKFFRIKIINKHC